MEDFPVIVRFKGLPRSLALNSLIERQARRLQLLASGIRRLEALVERREWPTHAPTIQVSLELVTDAGLLGANAGDFGGSNEFLAMETAFGHLRCRLPGPRECEPMDGMAQTQGC